ncbi:MAG TPA: hypothetical protein VJP78_05220 [Thermoleophilia bacterium]|nr:hypothetical protein [Thermoleophilia bacterium]
MALFRLECGGAKIEIWEVDHGPPHCHISGLDQAGTVVVDLVTLRVIKPHGLPLPPTLRRCMRENQMNMLEAWSRVISHPGQKE